MSKGAVLLLVWNVVVGATYGLVIYGVAGTALHQEEYNYFTIIAFIFGTMGAIALIQMLFYPMGGLIADVCCGRYRTVTMSMVQIWCGFFVCSITGILYAKETLKGKIIELDTLVVIIAILFIGGFMCFQANAVQFGLDQLQDASSDELSQFLHWYAWTEVLGEVVTRIFGASLSCNKKAVDIAFYLPVFFLAIISSLAALTVYKRKWFHVEPPTRNPYRTILKVLKFALKHDKPLRRGAFTFCDDVKPTRLDFAKQRFGGPFTTEEVEDVKTFLRILVMLFLIGCVFYLHVHSLYVFPFFGIHLGENKPISYTNGCHPSWMLLESGNLSYAVTIVMIPLYVIFFRSYVMRYFRRILSRFTVGVVLLVVSTISIFTINTIASHVAMTNDNNNTCLFLADVRNSHHHKFAQTLGFNTAVLIIPNLLTGIASPIIYITILEFISAQSPHTMKGLLLGVFYAVRGFFIMSGCVLVFPFTIMTLWESQVKKGMFDCGFYYYLMTTMLALVVIIIVLGAVRWYHYRDREDRPYGPGYVEDYYHRYVRLNQAIEEPVRSSGRIDSSILHYGTMDGMNL